MTGMNPSLLARIRRGQALDALRALTKINDSLVDICAGAELICENPAFADIDWLDLARDLHDIRFIARERAEQTLGLRHVA